MRAKTAWIALTCAAFWMSAPLPSRAVAGTCIADGCHKTIVSLAYLHGPVAAEEAGAEGCVSCHVPAGPACTVAKGGRFEFKTKTDRLCLLCHERSTGTQHTKSRGRCLSCHSPHGSDAGSTLMRAGK